MQLAIIVIILSFIIDERHNFLKAWELLLVSVRQAVKIYYAANATEYD